MAKQGMVSDDLPAWPFSLEGVILEERVIYKEPNIDCSFCEEKKKRESMEILSHRCTNPVTLKELKYPQEWVMNCGGEECVFTEEYRYLDKQVKKAVIKVMVKTKSMLLVPYLPLLRELKSTGFDVKAESKIILSLLNGMGFINTKNVDKAMLKQSRVWFYKTRR